jgi:hypothetical protein
MMGCPELDEDGSDMSGLDFHTRLWGNLGYVFVWSALLIVAIGYDARNDVLGIWEDCMQWYKERGRKRKFEEVDNSSLLDPSVLEMQPECINRRGAMPLV